MGQLGQLPHRSECQRWCPAAGSGQQASRRANSGRDALLVTVCQLRLSCCHSLLLVHPRRTRPRSREARGAAHFQLAVRGSHRSPSFARIAVEMKSEGMGMREWVFGDRLRSPLVPSKRTRPTSTFNEYVPKRLLGTARLGFQPERHPVHILRCRVMNQAARRFG